MSPADTLNTALLTPRLTITFAPDLLRELAEAEDGRQVTLAAVEAALCAQDLAFRLRDGAIKGM